MEGTRFTSIEGKGEKGKQAYEMKINFKTELNIQFKKNWIWGQNEGFPAPSFLNEQRG